MMARRGAKKFLVLTGVALFCLFSAFPFLIMIINTFKPDADSS